MEFVTIFFIAISLAMDAFAVSVSNGVSVSGFRQKQAIVQGTYFGVFQFFMPVLGWFLGTSVKEQIEFIDHWIAFGLLAVIGFNMIRGSLNAADEEQQSQTLTPKVLVLQAIATSIDALAVGISFALLNVNIWYAAAIIGIVAFVLSFFGGILGKGIGGFLQSKAEFIGGLVLIVIGLKIVLEHTILS